MNEWDCVGRLGRAKPDQTDRRASGQKRVPVESRMPQRTEERRKGKRREISRCDGDAK